MKERSDDAPKGQRDRLFLRRLRTPEGHVGHEVVAMVSAEAVHKARQTHEDASRAARVMEAELEARAAYRRAATGLPRFAAEWRRDRRSASGGLHNAFAGRLEAQVRRLDAVLARIGAGIGKGSRAGW